MSTNCVRCFVKPRVAPSLLCDDCRRAEWSAEVERMLLTYPDLRTFVDTYEASSGAGKGVFRGQACKMVLEVYKQAKTMDDCSEEPPAPCGAMELLRARCPKIEEDFLLALRFLYYVKAKPAVPDARYDEAEREFINRPEVEDSALMQPGSDRKEDYPDHVVALAFYLSVVSWENGQVSGKPAAIEAVSHRSRRKAAKTAEKPAGFVEAPYVGDLFDTL